MILKIFKFINNNSICRSLNVLHHKYGVEINFLHYNMSIFSHDTVVVLPEDSRTEASMIKLNIMDVSLILAINK